MIERKKIWRLTIRLVRPHKSEYEFLFSYPPTLEDFLRVCKRLPWIRAWDDSYLPLIKEAKWPKIKAGYKAARCALPPKDGRYGEIEIMGEALWENE